ncbi:acyl carrier protein [Erwinia tasmaniensis]|uniref:Meromycolate extension acyl carrier protein (ACP) n=1 Tax=Erwinia tasmaniensis (strain DSM 17950 / CFBP 7177 / CIP 109463 / NCPPB 4357 / Et1/99) TaxID=465817 RepID=B2VG34_ERWT9|nr:acyl carrier protein [Erwinia tasmaniensis]CAO97723.1 Meromycolate extension acyl carrier protein (ACP) [Erwinia tasmaniensis Et1/99]
MSDSSVDKNALHIVYELIFKVNGMLPHSISPQDSLIKDLGMDSVELVDFMIRLEEQGVVIKDSQLSSELTVGQVARLICK